MGFLSWIGKLQREKELEKQIEQKKQEEMWHRIELFEEYENDLNAKRLNKRYSDLFVEIGQRYTALNKSVGFSGREGTILIRQCDEAISLYNELIPIWKKYEEDIGLCPFYAKKAMICEKRGEYDRAAQVCVTAIRAGFDEDGTKGKMQGRLARMLKKGRLQPTPEMKQMMGEITGESE